jgi:hypothetical protein
VHPSVIPIGEFVSELPKQLKNKDAKLLIYCKAEASAKIAERLGYTIGWTEVMENYRFKFFIFFIYKK